MVSLAKAMIHSTYAFDKISGGHGLNVNNELKVKIKKCGEYQLFHDCYLGDTSIYSNNIEIDLKDLLSVIPGIAFEWKLSYDLLKLPEDVVKAQFDRNYDYTRARVDQAYKNIIETPEGEFNVLYCNNEEGIVNLFENEHFVHVMDVHYLSIFILCHFARYRPLKWIKIIEKSQDINSYLINAFLRRSELDFPILFYSELTGTKLRFSP